jgi:hypothetical protein
VTTTSDKHCTEKILIPSPWPGVARRQREIMRSLHPLYADEDS